MGGATRATGFVCATRRPMHPTQRNVERAWRAIREIAKLDGEDGKPASRLHDLRHSWASDAVSAGVPLYVVGAVLGHAHLHDAAIRDGLEKAGAAIEHATATAARETDGAAAVVPLPARRKRRARAQTKK